ncbi:hypothetical protein QA648_09640 [Rhizobium sp. CB3171]|uniref:hypothetical protein n=1 Tax=unclassified Rhizobium TaxID=2613769 RepID=UPI000CF26B3E|nr:MULTISPECIES: hypothetical protein [Rhizobium]MDK4738045.1 hypothetical protein [Rhizobium sp. CNPSo 3464]UWU19654.1 hypothetical protein N2601_10035 [Rhizobium tropici]WFU03971.1 hypothetical protein QA648_09640 [Rhizobium sp. CB3171]
MSEIIQGFLACVGAALFFLCVLAALEPIVSSSRSAGQDDASGAPEGDLVHFRMIDDEFQSEANRSELRGLWSLWWRSRIRPR